MLQFLKVKNFALIESLELHFGHGLNIITGETGAGKSIIVDALLAALGERTSADFVRHGAEKAMIEAVFNVEGNKPVFEFLANHDFDSHESELIMRREISARGSSRSFINDSPATQTVAKALGDLLVDFHGQHDHQSLLRAETHLQTLDNVGGLDGIVAEYREEYEKLRDRIHRLEDLLRREKSLREQAEFKRFQLNEILDVNPLPDEEIGIKAELSIIENAEQLHETTTNLYGILYEEQNSVRDQLVRARNLLDQLSSIDKVFLEFRADCQSALVMAEEIAKFTQSYNSRIEFEPERLEELRERSVVLARLRKKYGTFEEIFARREALESELALTENFEKEIERLRREIGDLQLSLGKKGTRLSKKRKETAREVEKSIVATLKNLGIQHAQFVVHFERIEATEVVLSQKISVVADGKMSIAYPNGIDKAEFFLSTNQGEDVKPLLRVASGGEISRVMLSLKTILAQSDRLPMLVFDEIDTGISGRIAQKVGIAMKNLSNYHQIISITHQPQIAALADIHVAVEKKEEKGKSSISAGILSEDERLREVAKLMSGEEITDASIQSARELMRGK